LDYDPGREEIAMNRRAFLTTAALTPIFADAFRRARSQAAGGRLLYVGTYTNNKAGSKGIYAWRFDAATAAVTSLGLVGETDSPSWIVVHPNKRFLYAANELPPPEAGGPTGAVTAFSIDAGSGKLTEINRVKTNGLSPAHMLVDPRGKWAIVGNYGNGPGSEGTSIAVFAVSADGRLAETPTTFVPHVPKPKRLDPAAPPPRNGNLPTSHPHCVLLSPDSRFLLVAEKGFDEIVVYRFDAAKGTLTPNTPPSVAATKLAAAPRHLAFGKGGKFLYVCYEAGRAVATYAYDARKGTLRPLETHSTLPPDAPQTGSCAEIEVHPDGNYLYVSNRGHNSLALFTIDRSQGTLTFKDTYPVGGTPRHFTIDPTGDYVFAEGQNNSVTVVFKIDRPSGTLTKTDITLDTPAPVCIAFV
jgi:6-phosphogluconolactonase